MLPQPVRPPDILDVQSPTFSKAEAARILDERGFVVLRNLFPADVIDEAVAEANKWMARPAVAGAPGYSKVDHPKKLLNSFVLGGRSVELLVNELVLDIAEAAMGSECILAETNVKYDVATRYVYFPIHSDFAAGWTKGAGDQFKLTAEDMKHCIGIGGALYLHDTADGAFCFCDGTHKLLSPHGQDIAKYPPAERDAILARRVRCDGRKGDLVLFDDRGFHGPDQPSTTNRLVILLDYFRVETFGRIQVAPMPIWSTDISRLSPRQLRAAGAGAEYMTHPTRYTQTRFAKNRFYPLITKIIEGAYLLDHWKKNLRARLNSRSAAVASAYSTDSDADGSS